MQYPIKLHQIRAFVEVSRCGSIRGAARELGLSQPALTKAIRELEEGLGAALLLRTSQGVTLTDSGRAFDQHAHLIIEELRRARENVEQLNGVLRGQIVLGVSATVARTLLPQVVARFRRELPNVKLRVIEGQLSSMAAGLRDGNVDFSINTVSSGVLESDLEAQPLFTKPFVVVMRRNHPKSGARHLRELIDCDWVLPTARSGYYADLADTLERHGFARDQVSVVCDSFTTSLNLLQHSDMVGAFASQMTAQHGMGELVELMLEDPLPVAAFHLVKRRGVPLTPVASRLARLFEIESRAS
ncbi:LysR family transcriptional regulator [Salinicola rhizosphaerae]|uniref:HTH-type transcriptional regulator AbgR n=1 Tax=Salinicola rhizosphaerae TaxID=1443141 RepID=A0ABQ3E842_9GAMM|nr:LysR family transcriptional regulator [Salinicola rhizosphaerae]GHB25574.1 HTH-type transcriptional regulator AbgR [Salinicola rhizosphaerae]